MGSPWSGPAVSPRARAASAARAAAEARSRSSATTALIPGLCLSIRAVRWSRTSTLEMDPERRPPTISVAVAASRSTFRSYCFGRGCVRGLPPSGDAASGRSCDRPEDGPRAQPAVQQDLIPGREPPEDRGGDADAVEGPRQQGHTATASGPHAANVVPAQRRWPACPPR
jgi:hypothetical protein